jgi:hypothetical protein
VVNNNKHKILIDQRIDKKGYMKEYTRLVRKENPKHLMYLRVKAHAKQDGREFNLDEDDITIPEICPILEIPLKYSTKGITHNSPSLDRVDNTKGYVKGNVRVISYKANSVKSNINLKDAERLVAYMKGEL